MNSLRELQEACYRAFALGDTAALLPAVRGNGIAPELRVEVYRNNSREIYRKALTASFPVVERLVGETCFAGLTQKYTREHPSRNGDLQQYGTQFAALLDSVYANSRFSYLSDVARLEWAIEEIHLEPDEPPLELAALGKFSPAHFGNLVFTVRRAIRLVESSFPILSIWRSNQPGNDTRVDLNQGGENAFVARQGNDLNLGRLDNNAFALASALARGLCLADAWNPRSDSTHGDRAHTAPDLAEALGAILNTGLFADVTAPDPPPANT